MNLTQSYFDQVTVRSWTACPNGADVKLYMIKEWAHDWPGPYFTAKLPEKHPLQHFDAARIIWDFFKRHSREGEPP